MIGTSERVKVHDLRGGEWIRERKGGGKWHRLSDRTYRPFDRGFTMCGRSEGTGMHAARVYVWRCNDDDYPYAGEPTPENACVTCIAPTVATCPKCRCRADASVFGVEFLL